MNPEQNLDQEAVQLARAIKRVENPKFDPNAKGASGEFGYYQWMPETWASTTKKYNLDAADLSEENQNKAAYMQIKELKDKGYQPDQIAAFWNSGKTEGWENMRGVNKYNVKYDVPGYVSKVKQAYDALGQGQSTEGIISPSTVGHQQVVDPRTTTEKAAKGLIDLNIGAIKGAGRTITGAMEQGEAIANQTAGRVVSAITGRGFKPLPEEELGGNIARLPRVKEALTPTNTAQKIGGYAEKAGEVLLPGGAVGTMALKARAAAQYIPRLFETLTPRVVGKAYEKAGMKGLVRPGGLFKGPQLASEEMKEVQNAVQGVTNAAKILNISPDKIVKVGANNNTQNLQTIDAAISDFSQKIVKPFVQQSGVNYNFADLAKYLENVKPPRKLTGDSLAAWERMKTGAIEAISNKIGPDVKDIRSLKELRSRAVDGVVPQKVLEGDVDFWNARKMIDDIFDNETKGKVFGDKELAGAKEGYKDLRGAFKEYLSEGYRYPGQIDKVNKLNEFLRTPQGMKMNKAGWSLDDIEKQFGLVRREVDEAAAAKWDEYMETLSGLFDAKKNIVSNIGGERGMGRVSKFLKEHPNVKAGLIGLLPTGIVGGYIGSKFGGD